MRTTIYPAPSEIRYKDGKFVFGKQMELRRSPEFDDKGKIDMLCELWNSFTGTVGELNVIEDKALPPYTFVLGATNKMINEILENDYCLSVFSDGAVIRANDNVGLHFGYYTLLQMINLRCLKDGQEYISIDCVEIKDKAVIKFRALHICMRRGFSLLALKQQVRMAGLMKFTHITIEFEASLKYDALPELSWPDGFSKDEIKLILEDARNMGMEIIPMVNHLGHAGGGNLVLGGHAVLDQNPKLAPLFEHNGWNFCISNPETKELLRKMRNEMIELCGEGSYFHIGLDEAWGFGNCDLCSEVPKEKLFADFVNEVSAELEAQGRRTMMWADMLLNKKQFNTVCSNDMSTLAMSERNHLVSNATDEVPTHKAVDLINKDVIMIDWQYYHREGDLRTTQHLMGKSYDTITATWYLPDNIKHICEETDKLNAYGYMSTIWGTITSYPELIPFSAEAAWYGRGATKIDSYRLETRFLDIATLQRKLLPNCPSMAIN